MIKYITIFLLVFNLSNFAHAIDTKSFKSKDGYSITYPKNYDVMEKKYSTGQMVTLFDKKKNDGGKNIMFILTGPKIFSAEYPYPNQISLGDEVCNALEEIYTEQLGKKANLEVCEKASLFKNGFKTVSDSMHSGYKHYQYSIEFNNQLIMISGSCKPENCKQRDRELSNLSLSIN
jgi:hypothetical protein